MQSTLPLTRKQRLILGISAFSGAMIGAKLPYALFGESDVLSATAWLSNGKTILTGILGGYLGVEVGKKIAGIKFKTGDSFAIPVAIGVGIGRFACFVGGCCYGTATDLPWGVNFGDGIRRHPTQIYETVFHFSMAALIYQIQKRGIWRGQLIKFYILSYLLYRFLTEFIRPETVVLHGLTLYQYIAMLSFPLFVVLWAHDRRLLNSTSVKALTDVEG